MQWTCLGGSCKSPKGRVNSCRFITQSAPSTQPSAVTVAATRAAFGTPLFFVCSPVMLAAYSLVFARVWNAPAVPAAARGQPDSCDGVSDSTNGAANGCEKRHGALSVGRPSAAARRAYVGNPVSSRTTAFFRMVVSLHDSTRAMQLTLVACDLLTILVVWRWLGGARDKRRIDCPRRGT